MTDQVQHLIDRIRKDAVQAADQQSKETLAKARAQADAIVAEARATAAGAKQDAEKHAQDMLDRGTRSLQQAARDVLLQVGDRMQEMVHGILQTAADQALRGETVEQMLLRLADGFAKNGVAEGQIDVIVGPQEKERLMHFAITQLREKLAQGVTVKVDPRLQSGFRLAYAGGAIQHDFSGEAVASALARLLRPQLAEIVMRAAAPSPARAGVP